MSADAQPQPKSETTQESERLREAEVCTAKAEKANQEIKAISVYERRSFWVQATIAAATSIYAIIAFFQLEAMNSALEQTKRSADAAVTAADAAADSAKTTRFALELSAIPEVQPEGVTCSSPIGPDSKVTLHFRNTGGRRATDVTIDWALDIPGVPYLPGPKEPSLILIGVNQVKQSTTPQTIAEMAGDVRARSIREGSLTLGLSGRIDYKDTFGHAHWTTFSYRYKPRTECTFNIANVSADH